MKSCAAYVAEAKAAFGDPRMSDRELGDRLIAFSQSSVSNARAGYMPDTLAVAIAKAIGIPPGEVLIVARAEREKNADVKGFLLDWATEAFRVLPPARLAPETVTRGGVKELRYSASQRWRKR